MRKFFIMIISVAVSVIAFPVSAQQLQPIDVVREAGTTAMTINQSNIPILEKEAKLAVLTEQFFTRDMARKILKMKNVDAQTLEEFRAAFQEFLICIMSGACKFEVDLQDIQSFQVLRHFRTIPGDETYNDLWSVKTKARIKNKGDVDIVFLMQQYGDAWKCYDLTIENSVTLSNWLRYTLSFGETVTIGMVSQAINVMKCRIQDSRQRIVQE